MRRFLLVACLGWFGGCADLGVVEGGAIIATDKSFSDHIISFTSGKDCSTVRREKGLSYCKEDEVFIQQNIFCYETLGSVTCYERPDPHKGGHQKLGDNSHNLIK